MLAYAIYLIHWFVAKLLFLSASWHIREASTVVLARCPVAGHCKRPIHHGHNLTTHVAHSCPPPIFFKPKQQKYITNRMSDAERTFSVSSIKQFVPETTGSKHRYIITASIENGWERSDNPLSGVNLICVCSCPKGPKSLLRPIINEPSILKQFSCYIADM